MSDDFPDVINPARARENRVYVISADRWSQDKSISDPDFAALHSATLRDFVRERFQKNTTISAFRISPNKNSTPNCRL